ncbi:hypothetical protein [Streptomyces sp. NPDC050416]
MQHLEQIAVGFPANGPEPGRVGTAVREPRVRTAPFLVREPRRPRSRVR